MWLHLQCEEFEITKELVERGEVASRAIQSREMMTDRERFETHPVNSYDVNFSDIIPLVGGRVIILDDKPSLRTALLLCKLFNTLKSSTGNK